MIINISLTSTLACISSSLFPFGASAATSSTCYPITPNIYIFFFHDTSNVTYKFNLGLVDLLHHSLFSFKCASNKMPKRKWGHHLINFELYY
jgi:hypothetical protein